jgi:hypothetical protein
MSGAAIICSNLSFAWPGDTPVFHDLSFSVTPAAPAWSPPTASASPPCSS